MASIVCLKHEGDVPKRQPALIRGLALIHLHRRPSRVGTAHPWPPQVSGERLVGFRHDSQDSGDAYLEFRRCNRDLPSVGIWIRCYLLEAVT